MAPLAILFLLPMVGAHTYSESGNITTTYPDQLGLGLFSLVERTAPGTHPQGLFYYTLSDARCGEAYTIDADYRQVGPIVVPQFRLVGCSTVVMDIGDVGEGFDYREG